jgi:hypothetical protein
MFKSNTIVQKFYFITILISMMTLTYGIWHYWNNGPANIENISLVFDASEKLQQIKKRDSLLSIKKLIDSDQVRTAVKDVDALEKGVKGLAFISANSKESVNLLKDIDSIKETFTTLISLPKLTKIINVLNTKMKSFQTFVVRNNWRTLTRISKRLNANLESKAAEKYNYYTVGKLQRLARIVKKDINLMSSVTKKSYLSVNEKNAINTKINALLVEVEMFHKYVKVLKKLSDPMKTLKNSYQAWMISIEPAITFKMIEFERDSKKILFALLGLLLFLGLSLLGGVFVASRAREIETKHVEDIIIDTVKEGIISVRSNFEHNFSVEFERELSKYKDYVHKRMSFGSVFRDAIPFSTLMLDSNLHTVWGNKQFYDLFGFSNNRESDSPLTWDFVNKFTNLGDDDPVMLALRKGIAGIYQVQVRPSSTKEESNSSPYEMYVTPVEYAGETRIVIFLYPLDSLEETLQMQMKSVVGPVSRSLEALNENNFNDDFQETIQNDFKIAGIENVFNEFIRFNAQKQVQTRSLENHIDELEVEAADQVKMVNDLHKMLENQDKAVASIKRHFATTKNNIISIVENKAEVEIVVDTEQAQSKKIIAHDKEVLREFKALNENIAQFQTSIHQMLTIKNGFGSTKEDVLNFKMNILQVIDQALILQKVEKMDPRISQLLTRIKLEVRSIDALFDGLTSSASQFDLIFSKLEIISKEFNVLDISNSELELQNHIIAYEDLIQDANQLFHKGRTLDENAVDTIRQLYNGFCKNDEELVRMQELISLQAHTPYSSELES